MDNIIQGIPEDQLPQYENISVDFTKFNEYQCGVQQINKDEFLEFIFRRMSIQVKFNNIETKFHMTKGYYRNDSNALDCYEIFGLILTPENTFVRAVLYYFPLNQTCNLLKIEQVNP